MALTLAEETHEVRQVLTRLSNAERRKQEAATLSNVLAQVQNAQSKLAASIGCLRALGRDDDVQVFWAEQEALRDRLKAFLAAKAPDQPWRELVLGELDDPEKASEFEDLLRSLSTASDVSRDRAVVAWQSVSGEASQQGSKTLLDALHSLGGDLAQRADIARRSLGESLALLARIGNRLPTPTEAEAFVTAVARAASDLREALAPLEEESVRRGVEKAASLAGLPLGAVSPALWEFIRGNRLEDAFVLRILER